MVELTELLSFRSFVGYQKVYQHSSEILKCNMKFGVYLPDSSENLSLPILFFLTGMNSNEMNFIEKTGFQRFASEHEIIVVNVDSSPRNKQINMTEWPENVGEQASYYLDATESYWVSRDYKMYSYLIKEFVPLIFETFPVNKEKCGIFGHSIGGHGALTISLKHPEIFKSISSFAAVCNPMNSPIRSIALKSYLGDDKTKWAEYDSVALARHYSGPFRQILIDQGSADHKIKDLMPENLIAVNNSNIKWDYRLREGYDHYNLYLATFIQEHFLHFLKQTSG